MATHRASPARAALDLTFEELYRELRADVYRAALRKLGNAQDAEDVTQAAFADAYRAVLRGARPQSPRAWLLAISENVRRRRFRTAQRRPREELVDDADFPLAAELPYEQSRALTEALATLPPEQRRVFVLREIVGLSYDEIAEELDSTVGSVQMLLFRARRSLRDVLDPPTVAIRRPVLPAAAARLARRDVVADRDRHADASRRRDARRGRPHRRRRQRRRARLAGGRDPSRSGTLRRRSKLRPLQPAPARLAAAPAARVAKPTAVAAPAVRADRSRDSAPDGYGLWPPLRRRLSPVARRGEPSRLRRPTPAGGAVAAAMSWSRSVREEAYRLSSVRRRWSRRAAASRADSGSTVPLPLPAPVPVTLVPVTPPPLPPPVKTATGAAGAAGASAPPVPVPLPPLPVPPPLP